MHTYTYTHKLLHYFYYYYYLLQLIFHSVAAVLTLEANKNILKRNNTETQYTQHKTQEIRVHTPPETNNTALGA
jgi:hypothetical protein